MAIEKGRQQYVSIKPEGTRLTAETTGFTKFIPFEEFSAMNENTEMEDRSGYGNRGGLLSKYVLNTNAKGSISGKLDADNITNFLHHTLGASTPTTALGATTWVYAINQSTELPTFTTQFERGDEGFKRLTGCTINKLDIEVGLDDSKYSNEIIAIKEEAGNSQVSAYTKPSKYLTGRHLNSYFATSLAGLGSVASPTGTTFKTRSVKISIENGASHINELSSVNPTNVAVNGFKITGEIEILLSTANNSAGFQTVFEAGTKQAFRFLLVGSDYPVIGTSALRPTLSFALPPSQIKVEPAIPLDDYLTQKITFEVEQPDLAVITLINSISAL